MRLDHLLSKEMSKGCIAVQLARSHAKDYRWTQPSSLLKRMRTDIRFDKTNARARGETKFYRESEVRWHDEEQLNIFPVAMRLGDTPVLIPNTMVKT